MVDIFSDVAEGVGVILLVTGWVATICMYLGMLFWIRDSIKDGTTPWTEEEKEAQRKDPRL